MRHTPAILLILAWFAATAYFFGLHVLGDTGRHTAAYFWTWDMYPGYETVSARRIVIARRANGQWMRLLPDGMHQFRLHGEAGRTGTHTRRGTQVGQECPTYELQADDVALPRGYSRIDLNREKEFLHRAVVSALQRHRGHDAVSRVVHVAVVDCYWPVRFNLPDEWAEPTTSLPSSDPRYWRIAAEAAVNEAGTVEWQPRGAER